MRNVFRSIGMVVALASVFAVADAQDGEASEPHAILVLFMTMTSGTHHVTHAQVASSTTPLSSSALASAPFSFELTDAQGVVLASGSFDDPRIQRGPLPPPGDPEGGHSITLVDPAPYVLRFEYSPNARYLAISSPGEDRQVIDVAPFL